MRMISDRTLLITRKVCGYFAVAAVLVFFAALAFGVVLLVALAVAVLAVCGWSCFARWIEVRQLVQGIKDPYSKPERDVYR